MNVEHEEVLMMPRWIDAKRVDFKYGLGDEFIEVLKTLDKLGLASTEPIDVKGQKVSPRDVVAAALPDPATLGPLMKGKTCAGLYVEGRRKDGKEGGLYLYHVADNEETMARDDSQAVTWQTAVNPVIALELLATGVWEGTGVRGPETFAPRPFLDLLARLEALVDEDVAAMASSPEGPAVYYLTSSFAAQSPLERTVVAATRLAQAGSAEAARALRDARHRWYGLIREEVLDPVVAKFVLLAGDGVSHQTDIRGEGDDEEFVSAEDIAALGALLARLRRS